MNGLEGLNALGGENLVGVGMDVDAGCDVIHRPAMPLGGPAQVGASTLLADHTTFHLGGPARRLVVATTERELVEAVKEADAAGEPLMVLAGGSNLLIDDAGFDGTVVKVATRGVSADVSSCGGAVVSVAAGENWDEFVAHAISQEWLGIECLSGIPGLVGASPIQNVGAYGADVSQTIYRVRTLDRLTGEQRTFVAGECGFAYRDSVFKRTRMSDGGPTGRYVVLEVTFQLTLGTRSEPIRYAELARTLGVEVGERSTTAAVREAVLELRRGKGMVHDPQLHDSWSAGSFFTNPVVTRAQADALPPDAPRYPAGGGMVKTSAAWLIEHAGFSKGFHLGGPGHVVASLSTRHTLALTNRGGARSRDVIDLARAVRQGVEATFGIALEPEPILVGCGL